MSILIPGTIFGHITLLELLPRGKALVACNCGTTYTIGRSYLASGKARQCASCGWDQRRKSKVGDVYDALTVSGFERDGERVWVLCRCVCGTTVRSRAEVLRRNKTNSCGCRPGTLWKGHEEISLTFYSRIKRNADARGIPFNVTIEHLQNLLHAQGHKCRLTGLPIHLSIRTTEMCTASVDRIDSSKGYEPDNVQWVHKDVNILKRDVKQERFIALCQLVARIHTEDLTHLISDENPTNPASQRGRRRPKAIAGVPLHRSIDQPG